MTKLHVHAVSAADTDSAVSLLDAELKAHATAPQLVVAFYGCEHDDRLLHEYLTARFPQAALVGGSSSGGFMTHQGVMGPQSLGVLLVHDEDGDYGAAAAPLGADAALTAETLLQQALAGCGCSGELPELIWVYQAPGREEAVIEGLRRVVGDRCPILGGSSADNDVSGRWRQLGHRGPLSDGLAVAVLLPSAPLGYAFRGGYEPAGPSGVVTGIGGGSVAVMPAQAAAKSSALMENRRLRSTTAGSTAALTNSWPSPKAATFCWTPPCARLPPTPAQWKVCRISCWCTLIRSPPAMPCARSAIWRWGHAFMP